MNIKRLLLAVLTITLGRQPLQAAQTYVLSVSNQVVVGSNFSFDIFIRRTGDPIDLGDCDMALTFNNAFFLNPGATGSNPVAGYTAGAAILSANTVIMNLTAPLSNPLAVPTTDVRVATVTISGIQNQAGSAGLQWVTSGSTLIQTHLGDDITSLGTYQNPPDAPLPIQLSSFTATVVNQNNVRLDWTTLTETNNYGFEVQKSQGNQNNYQTIPNSFIPGHGTTIEPHSYSYIDNSASVGSWYYRLKQIDLDATVHFTEGIQVDVLTGVTEKPLPKEFALDQNFPNPFNPSTNIEYAVPRESRVQLVVYNVLGQQVATLVDDVKSAGYYTTPFNASGFSSGLYFYRMNAGEVSFLKKMMLVK